MKSERYDYTEWKKTQDEAAEKADKPLKNNGESGIINTEEMLRRKDSAQRRIGSNGQQIIDVPTYNKLTKEFRKNGGVIIQGEEAEEHLKNIPPMLHIFHRLIPM